MKGKIALAAALATVVTVGGVYATWSFAENTANSASTTVNVAMTGITAATEKGTLSVMVMGANGFVLAVDDVDNNHKPDIKKEGVVTVTFTPAASASQDIKTSGIDVQFTVSYAAYAGGPATLQEWTYNSTQIFQFNNETSNTATESVHLSKESATKDDSTGVFTWTIQADQVAIFLTEAMEEVLIDTKDKYDDMNEILADGHFVLTVSECVTSHQ